MDAEKEAPRPEGFRTGRLPWRRSVDAAQELGDLQRVLAGFVAVDGTDGLHDYPGPYTCPFRLFHRTSEAMAGTFSASGQLPAAEGKKFCVGRRTTNEEFAEDGGGGGFDDLMSVGKGVRG